MKPSGSPTVLRLEKSHRSKVSMDTIICYNDSLIHWNTRWKNRTLSAFGISQLSAESAPAILGDEQHLFLTMNKR